jgi:phosphate/sulfate permease
MHASLGLVIITIALAFLFDFLNGFHDAANSIATIVSTRVLKPHWAVLWAAFFNFIAFAFFGLHVLNSECLMMFVILGVEKVLIFMFLLLLFVCSDCKFSFLCWNHGFEIGFYSVFQWLCNVFV